MKNISSIRCISIRFRLLTMSVRFDIMWDSQTYKRNPDTDTFFDLICEKLQQEIQRYKESKLFI